MSDDDWPECEEFYNLMQTYRHARIVDQEATIAAYRDVKDWLRAEIERNRAAIAELVQIGRAVVDRWDSPQWKDLPHTGEYIAKLRGVIAKYDNTTTKETK